MLDAAPFRHGFQERPVAAGRPSIRTPPSPPARARRTKHWLCFGCLSAASLATFSWRFKLPVASVRLSRSRAKRRLGNRRAIARRRVLSCQHPPERINHAQPSAASLKLNHAIGVGPGLGQSFRRRRPPHCAQRRVPIRGVTSGSPAPLTLRHGAKQLPQFSTARLASPAPLAGSRCSRPSPRPAPLACGPGRPCAAAPACATVAPPAASASCPGSGLLERRDTRTVAWLASLGDRLAFSNALSRASASVTMGYRPNDPPDPSQACTACR